jgi:predicted DsbA family dithiol-disulfide isomerase
LEIKTKYLKKMENTKQKISIPAAIIVAGLFIAIGLLLTRGGGNNSSNQPKTLSEQVGVSKEKLLACIEETEPEALSKSIFEDLEKAMSAVPENERGTPYSVVIGPNDIKTDIRGAYPYESVKAIIDGMIAGEIESDYQGEISPQTENDHVYGNSNALVTVIEYSDFECPYCKTFHATMKKIVDESNGQVKWIYRNFPLRQTSFEKLIAAECVAKIKGNDAYWQYTELLFGLLKTSQDSVADQL